MGTEIERKFLVQGEGWRQLGVPHLIRQGYLFSEADRSVRIRKIDQNAWLTVKAGQGMTRLEFEYPVPYEDAEALLALCPGPLIEKERRQIQFDGFLWEVDRFLGENDGLVLAEIELVSEHQIFPIPEWVDREVTHEPRYLNINLVKCPFSKW